MNFTPDGNGLFYARDNQEGTLLYQHVSGHAHCARHAAVRPRVPRRAAWPQRPVHRRTSPTMATTLSSQTAHGVPAKRVDIVFRDLTKPGSHFQVLVWGLDSRFSAIYAKGAWYRKDRLQGAHGPHPQSRSRCPARCLDDDRS